MNAYKGFKELDCYKHARELRKSIAALIATFPAAEKYELISQLRRVSRSVTANIAEGYGRYTFTDTRHFFIIARGSVTEMIEHLTTAFDEKYISKEVLKCEETKCEMVFKLINGFIGYLDKSNKQRKQPPNPITNS